MMLQEYLFTNITHLFYSGQYSDGLKQISQVMIRETNNSNLYVNRALFLSQLGDDEEAIRDLERALKINPRNYIAYFNLFSILTKLVEDEEAFQNLCCSLSCLYLIRGKSTKSLEDVDNSIRFCFNNHQSHVLRGLLLLQRQKYAESFLSFQNAHLIDPQNQIIKNLRKVAAEKGRLNDQAFAENIRENHEINYRLKCTYKVIDGADLFEEIDNRLIQFNRLYIDINSNAGAVTQKVPKESILSPQSSNNRGSRQQQIKIIYDSGLSTPKRHSEVHPEPGNVYIKSSVLHENSQKEFYQCIDNSNFEEQNFTSIINHDELAKNEACTSPIEPKMTSVIQDEFSSVINIDHHFDEEKEHFEQIPSEIVQINLPIEQKQEQIQESQQTEHYNLIYPLDDHMKLKISVLNVEFIDKDEAFLSKLTDVYCILNYNNGKNKLKTICKSCQDGICNWNQEFEPIQISENPSDMKIKIYNKKYKSFRDQFLGDLQVLITTADLLKLPLYNKNGILGSLLLHLQLVQVTPPPKEIPNSNEEEDQCL